ncbi:MULTISPECIES: Arm DNA-binding domain-containing protein [unclassified Bradyrhizobium]|uniref:Arm DNA-binding domain-containing protein n=1 Tax=unclassified Bradyrhizobium TaxID=2631580 RepID=UPI0028E3A873|nr:MULTISPECIES: Arm DNA-binding domain-containing protein [unclassified Bradyrhizobium]
MPKLTKKLIDGLKPAATDQVVFDDQVPGFGVRVTKGGAVSFLVQYRNAERRSRRMTIGPYGVFTVDEASRPRPQDPCQGSRWPRSSRREARLS